MAAEIPDIPPDMRKVYLRLKRWRSSHDAPRADSGFSVDGGGSIGPRAWD